MSDIDVSGIRAGDRIKAVFVPPNTGSDDSVESVTITGTVCMGTDVMGAEPVRYIGSLPVHLADSVELLSPVWQYAYMVRAGGAIFCRVGRNQWVPPGSDARFAADEVAQYGEVSVIVDDNGHTVAEPPNVVPEQVGSGIVNAGRLAEINNQLRSALGLSERG